MFIVITQEDKSVTKFKLLLFFINAIKVLRLKKGYSKLSYSAHSSSHFWSSTFSFLWFKKDGKRLFLSFWWMSLSGKLTEAYFCHSSHFPHHGLMCSEWAVSRYLTLVVFLCVTNAIARFSFFCQTYPWDSYSVMDRWCSV